MRCRPKLGSQCDNKAQYRPNPKTDAIDNATCYTDPCLIVFFSDKSPGALFSLETVK